jgi:shikimate dehydrogenase
MSLRFAVIGAPVEHSRSPQMHEAAYRALGIDATYERVHVEPEDLERFLDERSRSFRGFNATLPHKEHLLSLVDVVTERATVVGAINSVTVEADGRLEGDNTDAPGLVGALAEAEVVVKGARVVVLGAGGAARASVVGLGEAGAARITVVARRPEAASSLCDSLAPYLSTDLDAVPLAGPLDGLFGETDLLVQATSATLGDTDVARAFASSLPLAALPDHAVVTDLVYAPLRTTVLAAAESRGLRTADGLGLLIHQGALSFERWLGRPAPIDAMRRVLE